MRHRYILQIREDWTIYRGPSFLAVVLFGSTPPPPLPGSKLDRRHTGRLRKRDNLLTGEGGDGGRRGADCKNAWSTMNQSILSASNVPQFLSVFLSKPVCYRSNWLAKLPTLIFYFLLMIQIVFRTVFIFFTYILFLFISGAKHM